jgi:hypothetical protein
MFDLYLRGTEISVLILSARNEMFQNCSAD